MRKTTWIILPVLLLLLVAPASAININAELLVGGTKEGLYVGAEAVHSNRKMIGFFGYQEDYYKGMVGLNIYTGQMIGYVQGGRQAFSGNLKYHVSAYAGNIYVRDDFTAGNRLGVSGDIMRVNGDQGYGIQGEINIVGGPGFSFVPYYEWRTDRILQAMVGIGSHKPFVRIRYYTDLNQGKTIFLESTLNSDGLDSRVHYLFAEDLTLMASYFSGNNEFGVGVQWDPEERPYSAGIKWSPARMQWITSYRF